MVSVIARIALRYIAGALVAKGVFDASTGSQLAADADVLHAIEIGLGVGLATVSEVWYSLARKLGWSK